MIEILEHKTAAKYIEKYFDVLTKTGYLKSGTTKDYLRYLFLVDFIDTLYPFLTEMDYDIMGNVLRNIFSHGDCLLSYPLFCTRRNVIGKPYYTGKAIVRITETDKVLRITEDLNLRGV